LTWDVLPVKGKTVVFVGCVSQTTGFKPMWENKAGEQEWAIFETFFWS
jgi:hypothetical protein